MVEYCLLDREFNGGSKHSNYYSSNILKNYFDSSNHLHKHEINLDTNGYRSFFITSYGVEFSEDGNYMATVHNDDFKVWNLNSSMNNFKTKKMKKASRFVEEFIFNKDSSKIVYGNSSEDDFGLYLNDIFTGEIVKYYSTNGYVHSLTLNPKDFNSFSFTDCFDNIFHCDFRNSVLVKIKIKNFFKEDDICSILHHPVQENLMLVSCKSEKNQVFTIDLRNHQILTNYELPFKHELDYIKLIYNKKGTQFLVTLPDKRPILYNSNKEQPLYEFDDFGYYNSCLPRSCCFMGIEDEYIALGSQNSNTYVWKIPKDDEYDKILLKRINKTKFILKGHTNEINIVRYNNSKFILASLGVGKLFFWSFFPFKSSKKDLSLSNEMMNEIICTFENYSNDVGRVNNDFTNLLPFIFEELYNIPKLNDNNNLRNIFNMKSQIEKHFEDDSVIKFIHSCLINFKIDGKLYNMELLLSLKQIPQEMLDNPSLNERILSFIYEIKKVFEDKFKYIRYVSFLNLHIKLAKKTKKKLVIMDKKKPSETRLERLKSLKKIILVMKIMVFDLIVILKSNEELYEFTIVNIRRLLRPFDVFDETNRIEFKLKEGFFKNEENIYIQRNLNEINSFFVTFIASFENRNSILNQKYLTNRNIDSVSENETNSSDKKSCLNLKTKKLNLFQHYTDDILSHLENNQTFKEDFKREIDSLKIFYQ